MNTRRSPSGLQARNRSLGPTSFVGSGTPGILLLMFAASACNRSAVVLVPGDGGVSVGVDGGGPEVPGLLELRIDPPTARVVVSDPTQLPRVRFTALGRFADGERDVSALVAWHVEDEAIATIAEGEVACSGTGGVTRVVTTTRDLEASAELSVAIDLVTIAPGAPADAPSRFPEDTAADELGRLAPVVIYPANETVFPRNVNNILHQWSADPADDLFEVRFDSNVARIRHYTTERSFLLADDARRWLADTHAGRTVQMTVRALTQTSTGTVRRSAPITLAFSQSAVIGALYYWSTGVKGILRATLDAPSATKFYPNPDDDDTCVSCHTVSRDGRRLAAGYGGEKLRIASIPERDKLVPADGGEDRGYGWGTFNPGATRLLFASKGILTLLDADTGANVSAVELPSGVFATHPDWSPDGRWIAFAMTQGRAPGNKDVKGSSLARMEVRSDGTFGAPEILVQSAGDDDTIYFPSHSPDSRWIAFVRGRGKSKDNRTSELFVVRSDGSAAPILLQRLNRVVGVDDEVANIGNSMPTWAPSTRPEINWLAFSSLRAYGDVFAETDRDQLWAAAIDLDRAAAGADPSAPAFWLPFQSLDEGNHRAFWALATDEECPSTIEICDSLDNDCDGIVDEACCTQGEELCGDALDNDCDGAVDESCGCESQEECTNGIDDDCDGLVDGQDEDCSI